MNHQHAARIGPITEFLAAAASNPSNAALGDLLSASPSSSEAPSAATLRSSHRQQLPPPTQVQQRQQHLPPHHQQSRSSDGAYSYQHHPTQSAARRLSAQQLSYHPDHSSATAFDPSSSIPASSSNLISTRNPSPPLFSRPSHGLKRNSTPSIPRPAFHAPSMPALPTSAPRSPYPERIRSSSDDKVASPSNNHTSSSHNAAANSHLAHYTLGDCLGRGAFGSVFRGLNWMTGETVAVKQIQLGNIPKSELGEIMSEIDLLKNLNHPNIVKYKGSENTRDYLYIILEYCENGSLHNICKRFGKFPEGLVGVYISQVLDGLLYLHEQGVIHRDIKGANILTTKDGSVKLADFGVATKTGAMNDYAVVGSPYWMAPEVIDQSGATTASDIWSVGCVVVELLEGKPPYHYLAPMPALFRIVQDDYPPLPEGSSPIVKDFLLHCFQKDANLRVSARKLLKHPWMVAARRQLDQMKTGGSLRGSGTGATVHDEAVKSVREWNEALQEPPKASVPRANDSATVRAPAQPKLRRVSALTSASQDSATARPGMTRPKGGLRPTLPADFSQPGHESLASSTLSPSEPATAGVQGLAVQRPAHSNAASSAAQLVTSKDGPSSPSGKRPLVGAAPAPSLIDQRSRLADLQNPEEDTDNWDDDFEEDITTTKIAALEKSAHTDAAAGSPRKLVGAATDAESLGWSGGSTSSGQTADKGTLTHAEYDQQTIRPSPLLRSVSSLPQVKRLNYAKASPPARGHGGVEDYSDLVEDGDETHLNERIQDLKLQNSLGKRLFHPDDLNKLSGSGEGDASSATNRPLGRNEVQSATRRGGRADLSPQSTTIITPISPTASRANSLKAGRDDKWKAMRQALGRYSEDRGDEDYSDVFGKGFGREDQLSLSGPTLQLTTRLSQRSWLGDDKDDEDDPFAEIDEGLDAEADMEANVARDKHARTCAHVAELVERLQPESSGKELLRVCEQIDQVLTDMPEMKTQLLGSHGALALIQLLEISSEPELVTRLLGILNLVIFEDAEAQENLCLIGAIPVVMTFTTKKWPHDLRLEAAHFVFAMCSTSRLTLQFVLSCRGLRTLVDLIDENYEDRKDLVWIGVGCVSSVLELQSPASRTDFCRMLAQEGLLEPLSTALLSVLRDAQDPYARQAQGHILQTILIFSQSDNWLKRSIATRSVLRKLLQTSSLLDPEPLTQMLKIVKNLSMSPTILDEIQNANTIEILTDILTKHHGGPHGTEMSNQVLNTMYNLCRLSKSRQEEAAQSGIVPQLLRVAQTKSPLKQFALPILCDLAHTGKGTRKILWQHRALHFYVRLLEDPYWQVSALDSIHVWLQDETHRVEEVLLQPHSIDSLLCLFATSKANSFENLLEPFLKICRLSSGITIAMAKNPTFLRKLVDRFKYPKAVVRLNLLRICKMICDLHPDRNALIQQFSLFEIIDKLSKHDGAVLVRELARDILSQRYMQAGPRTVRRTMSDVGSSPSAPSTLASRSSIAAIPSHKEAAQETDLSADQVHGAQPTSPVLGPLRPLGSPREHGSPKPKRRLPLPNLADTEAWDQNAHASTATPTPSLIHPDKARQATVLPRRAVLRDRSVSPSIGGGNAPGTGTGTGARPAPRSLIDTFADPPLLAHRRTPSPSPHLHRGGSSEPSRRAPAVASTQRPAVTPSLSTEPLLDREDQERTMRPPPRPASRRPIPSLPDTGTVRPRSTSANGCLPHPPS